MHIFFTIEDVPSDEGMAGRKRGLQKESNVVQVRNEGRNTVREHVFRYAR